MTKGEQISPRGRGQGRELQREALCVASHNQACPNLDAHTARALYYLRLLTGLRSFCLFSSPSFKMSPL